MKWKFVANPKGTPLRVLSRYDGTAFEERSYPRLHRAYMLHHEKASILLPPGWEADMQDDLCRHMGLLTDGCEPVPYEGERRLGIGDIVRFMYAALNFLKAGGRIVSPELAEQRSATCATCPMRTGRVHGCWGCASLAPLLRQAGNLAGLKLHTSNDKSINYCGACGCYLKLKVWLPIDAYRDDGVDYPDNCWVKRESV
jgi:hypothetical protein